MARSRSDQPFAGRVPGEAPYRWFFAADRQPPGDAPRVDVAAARQAAALAAHLLGLPRAERLQAARREARFHRPTLLALLNLRAEDALLRRAGGDSAAASAAAGAVHSARTVAGGAGEDEAELAAALAPLVPRDRGGRAWKAGALAHWLLGKARLRRGDLGGARIAFSEMFGFILGDDPSAESALAAAGWAQVDQRAGCIEEAVAHFQRAAYMFAQVEDRFAAAACLAEVGFLLLATGDWMLARRNLQRAWHLLDPPLSPGMAGRVALACAECEVLLQEGLGTGWLERARSLYSLPALPGEDLGRSWSEGRIAAAAGRRAEAELLLDGVRKRLLAEGSLQEAVTISCDQLVLLVETRPRPHASGLIQALRDAFPAAAGPWADALQSVADLAGRQGIPEACRAANLVLERLRAAPPAAAGRPDLVPALSLLTDRLLRHCGELEEPLGAARGL